MNKKIVISFFIIFLCTPIFNFSMHSFIREFFKKFQEDNFKESQEDKKRRVQEDLQKIRSKIFIESDSNNRNLQNFVREYWTLIEYIKKTGTVSQCDSPDFWRINFSKEEFSLLPHPIQNAAETVIGSNGGKFKDILWENVKSEYELIARIEQRGPA